MKILLLHNYYKEPGGEDQVFSSESDLLKGPGHLVVNHTVHNDQVSNLSKSQLAAATLWSIATLIGRFGELLSNLVSERLITRRPDYGWLLQGHHEIVFPQSLVLTAEIL